MRTKGDRRGAGTADAVVVIGCGGGAGASVLVTGLAGAADRRGLRVVALDLDAYAGGLDVVFGIERADGVRWAQVAGSVGALDGAALYDALPAAGPAVLSYGREGTAAPAQVVAEAVTALAACCDLLLIDAPRDIDPQDLPADAVPVVVAHGSVRGTAAAGVAVARLRSAGRDPVVVLRDASDRLAEELSDAVEVQVVAQVTSERRVRSDLARGERPGAQGDLAKVCDELLERLIAQRSEAAA
ncbi:hypothetical protein [Allobranchiibius huperziae]|uniref:Mrp family chromosome partitioning ATPase n=1 Tax=Allobranchiibius huperziae TaxID=1874116 RepID=A0A853DGS7_9MICO|nr:hypothetical protein [Allobranchiibius huperziae]NYJ73405.1 Mrp family chromosome partitioning ATPase [Allobranchiibius huperziae]